MFGHTFHHLGIACSDMESTASFVASAFDIASDSGTIWDPEQNAFVRLFNADTPFAIELVAGRSVEDIVRRGVSYYHLCYEADDIDAAIAQAVKLGAIRVRPPKPAVLFGGRLVAFVFTPLGLIEFLERA